MVFYIFHCCTLICSSPPLISLPPRGNTVTYVMMAVSFEFFGLLSQRRPGTKRNHFPPRGLEYFTQQRIILHEHTLQSHDSDDGPRWKAANHTNTNTNKHARTYAYISISIHTTYTRPGPLSHSQSSSLPPLSSYIHIYVCVCMLSTMAQTLDSTIKYPQLFLPRKGKDFSTLTRNGTTKITYSCQADHSFLFSLPLSF